jgi:hypothetical protein
MQSRVQESSQLSVNSPPGMGSDRQQLSWSAHFVSVPLQLLGVSQRASTPQAIGQGLSPGT